MPGQSIEVIPLAPHPAITAPAAQQADTDAQLLGMWLHGRPATTVRSYRRAIGNLLAFTGKSIRTVTASDVMAFADSLEHLAPSSRATMLASVKSLFTFAHRLGYVAFNVGAPLRLPKIPNRLAERILPEEAVLRMIALEPDARNRALLRLMYAGGPRVSEIAALKWRDMQEREKGTGQATLYGKGGKTRAVLFSAATWAEVQAIRAGAVDDEPVFRSAKGGHLDTSMIWRIVRAAAVRAGLDKPVSPHWYRHANASHALDRGAKLHVVQASLGHANMATTGRYTHARPEDGAGLYLAV